MDFKGIATQYQWTPYQNQNTNNLTYMYVFTRQIARLAGESDILYVGQTDGSMAKRYADETSNTNTAGNTQITNIRLTHVFQKIQLANVNCYFTTQRTCVLHKGSPFLGHLETWDKRTYLEVADTNPITISLEKYLLVAYATDHLELPPMNCRF